MIVGTSREKALVPKHSLKPGKDVGRKERARKMADMEITVGRGWRYGY
jgi:hypothetical protein